MSVFDASEGVLMQFRQRLQWLMSLSLITCLLFGGGALSAASTEANRPLVVAHRGGAALMPENTFPAFDHAVDLGVDWLEFDIEMTSDDRLIVQHDGTINPAYCSSDRGSGVAGTPVRSLTLAQLQRFDCGSKHRNIYPRQMAVPGAQMPTPDSLFARYKRAKVTFYGEAKMPGADEGNVDPVLFSRKIEVAVRKHHLEGRFILQSSDYRTLDAMHVINPRIRTCLLTPWRHGSDFLKLARQHHATCMLLRIQDADTAQVEHLQDAGILVVSEVIDDEVDWRRYRDRGDDAIFTNDPAGLMAFLKPDTVTQHPLPASHALASHPKNAR
jgi:glycerophosphoryl diester phosphodiesterase